MSVPSWQLKTPIEAMIFDCDGTLSQLEGVNELARINGVGEEVSELTEKAMSETSINPALYQQRLALIKPTETQLLALGKAYYRHCVPDVIQVIAILQKLNKMVYVLSAGMNPAVKIFGEKLGLPQACIYAVDLNFDERGNYLNFDHRSPLIQAQGKREIIQTLKEDHPSLIHVGDGLNDYVTHDIVTKFIGYGGIYYRAHIESLCEYYIKTASLAALLPLCLTADESEALSKEDQILYAKGISAIDTGLVTIKS